MNYRISIVLALVLSAVILGGCVSAPTHQAMTVPPQANALVNPKLKNAVRIGAVTGGQETEPTNAMQVGNAEFKKALENSLTNAGYLAQADNSTPYVLSAELYVLNTPLLSFQTTPVRSSVGYKLRGNGATKDYQIQATGVATSSDAFEGIKRLGIATERSMLENIKTLLKELESF